MTVPKTMTVGKLRELLEGVEDDVLVGYAYPAGDYWRRTLLGEITHAEMTLVEYSEYHRAFQVKDEEEDEEEDDSDREDFGSRPFVLILK